MADYYEVLRRALAGLPRNTGEARRGVYEKARQALVRQLDGFDPPLPPTEVTRQRLSLEECIRKVEAEAARESLGLSSPNPLPATPPPPPPPPPARSPVAPPAPVGAPDGDTFTAPPPAGGAMPSHTIPRASVAPTAAAAGVPGQSRPQSADIFRQAIAEAEALGGAAAEAARSARHAIDEDDEQDDWPEAESEQVRRSTRGGGRPVPRDRTARRQPTFEEDPDDDYDDYEGNYRDAVAPPIGYDRQGPSALPRIIGLAVLLLVIVGFAAFAYSQRDFVMAIFEDPAVSDPDDPVSETPPDSKAGVGPKTTDRLLGTRTKAPKPDVRVVATKTIVPPANDDDALTRAPADDKVDTGTPATTDPKTTDPETTAPAKTARVADPVKTTAPTGDPATALVAQRSVLYEQGDSGVAGKGYKGQVTWETATEKANTEGGKPQTVLRVRANIAERNVSVEITVRKNRDPTLSASHLIDVIFALPDDFDGKGIGNVPAMIMKNTEESRGDALVGISTRVQGKWYWIALSDGEREKTRNESLLLERGWMEIPVLYENGKRALLTLEKGTPGQKAIEKALAAWSES